MTIHFGEQVFENDFILCRILYWQRVVAKALPLPVGSETNTSLPCIDSVVSPPSVLLLNSCNLPGASTILILCSWLESCDYSYLIGSINIPVEPMKSYQESPLPCPNIKAEAKGLLARLYATLSFLDKISSIQFNLLYSYYTNWEGFFLLGNVIIVPCWLLLHVTSTGLYTSSLYQKIILGSIIVRASCGLTFLWK